MSLHVLPTTHATGKQGTTEELDIIRDGDTIVLITGLTKVDFGRQNVVALSDEELNWVVDSVQICQSASAPPAEEELCKTVDRGKRRPLMGLVLDAQNLVTEVSPGGPADGRLQVGDRLVEIDGVALRGRQAHAVLTPAPAHTLRVRRRNCTLYERVTGLAPAGP